MVGGWANPNAWRYQYMEWIGCINNANLTGFWLPNSGVHHDWVLAVSSQPLRLTYVMNTSFKNLQTCGGYGTSRPMKYLSNGKKNLVVLGYLGDDVLPSCVGIIK